MKMNKTLIVLTSLILVSCQQTKKNVNSSWILNQQLSHISLITTKNNSIAEVSEFKTISGTINSSGYLQIELDLISLETNIPIRNERMQNLLFQTNNFPTADIHTQLKQEDLNSGIHTISFDVDLHGVSSIMTAEFMVFEQSGNKIVTLHKPLIVHANMFALEEGITTLKNIAKLKTIDFTVPMNIILTFEKNN